MLIITLGILLSLLIILILLLVLIQVMKELTILIKFLFFGSDQ